MIVVVGDLIVDVYHRGSVRGISAETPTMVMLRESTETFQGGAGLVRRHLQNLEKDSLVLTMGREQDRKYSDTRVVVSEGWTVSKKERFFVDNYKLFQVDEINRGVHTDSSRKKLHEELERYMFLGAETLVVCDNGHGVIDYRVSEFISDLREEIDTPFRLIVNSQGSQKISNYDWFVNADLLVMNFKECLEYHSKLCGCSHIDESGLYNEHWICHVGKMRGCDLVVTLGKEGSIACIDQNIYRNTPSVIGDIIDTCGAGDAFLSVLASCDWKKDPFATLQLANDYAAFHCTLLGTQVKKYEKEH